MHFSVLQTKGGAGSVRAKQVTLGEVLQAIFQRLQECETAESCLEFIGALLGLNELIKIPLGAENQDLREVLASLLSQPDKQKELEQIKSRSNADAEATDPSEEGVPANPVTLGPQTGPSVSSQQLSPETPKSAEEQLADGREANWNGLSRRVSQSLHEVTASHSMSSDAAATVQEFLTLPLFPSASEGGPLRRCFVFLEEPAKSIFGRLASCLLTIVILVSTTAFVMESMPEFRYRPAECARLRTAGLPLTAEACEPVPHDVFQDVEVACICVFTVEYLLRVLTVGAGCAKVWQGVQCTWRYSLQPINVIDLAAILPSYLQWAIGGGGTLGFLRVLRLARVLRILKLAKRNQGMQLIARVMLRSGRPLGILLFFNILIVMVFGSLIHFAEGQRFSVAPEFTQPRHDPATNRTAAPLFPTGVYVRRGVTLEADEVTPYRSIPYSLWWVCVTLTTVGYGDYSPTTPLGKVIGVACFYTGVLFIALPFSVMSSNFELVYESHIGDQDRRAEELKIKKEKMRQSIQRIVEGPNSLAIWEVPWTPAVRSVRRKIFFVLEQPAASRLGRIVSSMLMATIIAVTASFIMESMPEFNSTPRACQEGLTVTNCQPKPLKIFATVEMVGVLIFTVEYLLRVLTVHTASAEECGLVVKRKYTRLRKTLAYCREWMNLVDLLAIAPFYFELAMGAGSQGAGTSVLRVFRLVRIFRMLRMPKLSSGVTMFANIVADSMPALLLLFSLTLIGCVFFASCLTFAEGSWYSLDHFREEYPEGLYIRPTKDGHGIEPSPFRSILYTFWWFFTTATTVGYGDDYPTTTAGRIIGVAAAYVGILLIALPVTIVGGSFSKYYSDWVEGMQDQERRMGSLSESQA
mmetsp:Transcript_113798/g.332412  ORF Transcript_113798/g.332412 Transcript_113798/m.332412 type:complete len:865 (-) Transcript_113798:145-2739(-)